MVSIRVFVHTHTHTHIHTHTHTHTHPPTNPLSRNVLTIETDSFNDIGSAFLLNKPYVYDSNLPSSLAARLPNMQAVLDHKFVTTTSAQQTHTLTTVGGKSFLDFAKNSAWNSGRCCDDREKVSRVQSERERESSLASERKRTS
jgi:Deoxyribonuclease II